MKEIFLNIKKHKKANAVLDTAMVIVVLVIFGLLTIFTWNIWQDLKPSLDASFNESVEAQAAVDVIETRYPSLFDGLFLFIFIGLWITTLIASFMIDTHPIFFIVSFILLIIVLVSAVYIGNFYEEIVTTDSMGDSYTYFPAMHHVLSNLLIYAIVIGASITLVLFGKKAL